MEFQIIACDLCPHSTTFYTVSALADHRLDTHERPVDEPASATRLAFEAGAIGRARIGPWVPDNTHWHVERISHRAGGNE